MSRVIPESYYYPGQGRLLVGDRNPTTGKGENFVHVGNVTALSLDIAVEKFEHKESMTGQRSIDKTIIKEKKATTKFTCESLSLENLALGLYGDTSLVTGATVVDEPHVFRKGGRIALNHPDVSAVTMKVGASTIANTAIDIDADFGSVGEVDGQILLEDGDIVLFSYTYGGYKRLDMFTEAVSKEKYLRFEGLNTANEDLVLIDMPRVAFDPITGFQLINEELGSTEFTGNVLLDTKITSGSQFLVQRIITPA